MSKKIESAHRKLVDALEKHAELASGKKSHRGRIESAAADVKRAATKYAAVVAARTDTQSPFSDIADPRLDRPTIASLTAERDALTRRLTETPLTATDLQVPLPTPESDPS
ncbi:hypothetical protein GRS96_19165 (plasmid) [Rathayibacter sp. VKM Ac-2803]|uniref:Uncharacterized protein n=1 Tax=Rathayibacter caricis DSM 15933 TaxID=1328867 RepID=A0A2T4UNX0_9MICO|nr:MULTISPECIES: hypothetical protein [Rathayibacter]MWV51395.1 hypothetical protein [Rathayibacter sp. VKM Ac-2803]PTL71222.1 hypothetical protein C1I63_18450 [Rathayibacter caricis DSM 15933]